MRMIYANMTLVNHVFRRHYVAIRRSIKTIDGGSSKQPEMHLKSNILTSRESNNCQRNINSSNTQYLPQSDNSNGSFIPIRSDKNPIKIRKKAIWEDHMMQRDVKNVLDNTHVIDDERDSSRIIDKMLKSGNPIGVDMEGHHFSIIQLVQIKASDGPIYIFRTGINPKLLYEGKLKRLLEDRNITKVFHAGVGDSIAVYKSGVKMVNMYDTAIAHNVIQYQNLGRSIHLNKGNHISFNKICDLYGLLVNPMKTDMKKSNLLWKRENIYQQTKLSNEVIAYSAFDVEPLLELQKITHSLIENDFQHIFKELCEDDVIRNVDPELLKLRSKRLKEKDECDIFIDGLIDKTQDNEKGVGKTEIYETLASHSGLKEIYFSGCSAHVIMPNRQSAILLYQDLTENKTPGGLAHEFYKKFGPKARVNLVSNADSSEIVNVNLDNTENLQRLKDDNYVTDSLVIRNVMDILLKVNGPVILDFTVNNEGICLELYVGMHPVIKLLVTPISVENGIGDLMSSNDIVKIVPRLDSDNVHQALKIVLANGYEPSNFFDLNAANKAIDYAVIGQSFFKANSMPVKTYAARFGVNTPTKFDDYMYTYLHLVNQLPSSILNFLSEKAGIDIDIGTNSGVPEAKEKKRKLRLKHDSFCVHITCKGLQNVAPSKKDEATIAFESLLKEILNKNSLQYERIDVFDVNQIIKAGGVIGIVQLCHRDDVQTFISIINQREISNTDVIKLIGSYEVLRQGQDAKVQVTMSAVSVPSEKSAHIDSKSIRSANLRNLIQSISPTLEQLEKLGFINTLNQYKLGNESVENVKRMPNC